MTWATEIAKEFKQRDNPNKAPFTVGIVEKIAPLRISAFDGTILLDKHDLLIADCIQSSLKPLELTCSSVSFTLDGIQKTAFNFKAITPTIKLRETLFAKGDRVLLATEDNQSFVILDILREVD